MENGATKGTRDTKTEGHFSKDWTLMGCTLMAITPPVHFVHPVATQLTGSHAS